jgi:DNA helicase IV
LAEDHAVTFVIDTVQRIYARGFTWTEAGFDVRPQRYHILRVNHRNTAQIAGFAAGILSGIGVEGDGALPNLGAATRAGEKPVVLRGSYHEQVSWALDWIQANVDLASESVAFLKPQGGNWFAYLKAQLAARGIRFATITREADWPTGSVNVALSTFHSAKGLEFDHVFIVGLNQENTQFDDAERDDQIFVLRRLLAVAVARARETVVVGFKLGAESRLAEFFAAGTYQDVRL